MYTHTFFCACFFWNDDCFPFWILCCLFLEYPFWRWRENGMDLLQEECPSMDQYRVTRISAKTLIQRNWQATGSGLVQFKGVLNNCFPAVSYQEMTIHIYIHRYIYTVHIYISIWNSGVDIYGCCPFFQFLSCHFLFNNSFVCLFVHNLGR